MRVNLFGQPLPEKRKKGKSKKVESVGCEGCPLDKMPGVRKVKGLVRITGRRAMLWAQSPGRIENLQGKELVGAVGKFLWEDLARFGMEREHFDVQNVLRCQPLNEDGTEHPPTKEELHHCSIFNEHALERNQGKAHVHLILGKVAGAQLLGRRFRKDQPIFWHESWNAYVVYADHPSFLLRKGGRKAGWPYYTFRDRLKAVAVCYKYPGRFGYIKAQNYKAIYTEKEFDVLEKTIYAEAKAGRRISLDIEDGVVDGKQVILLCGFGWGEYSKENGGGLWSGNARAVVLYHPENKQPAEVVRSLIQRIKAICEDPTIKKCLQHGNYDQEVLWRLEKIRLRGYNFDTQYAMYLKHPHLRSYSIPSLIKFFLQEFQDYKEMVAGYTNFAEVPLTTLIPYNCADCDVTKRAEAKSGNKINQPLLEVYIHVAPVLDAMEKRGPILNWKAHEKLGKVLNERIAELEQQLKAAAGNAEFNPGSSQEVAALIYDRLKLPILDLQRIGGKAVKRRSTTKDILQTLLIKTGHPVLKAQMEWRGLIKMKTTYHTGFARSAEIHGGEIRTIWWLTGAVTGRLRSGKGDKAEAEGIINFQNLHKNTLLRNLLVSDHNWERALEI